MEPFYQFIAQAVDRSLTAFINAAEGKPTLAPFKDKVKEPELLKIGELAKETGISEHTLRFWTDEGLLSASRTSGNYRLYNSSAIAVIKEIQRLKETLRLTLPEIKERIQKFGY